jgi:hypothetical protein
MNQILQKRLTKPTQDVRLLDEHFITITIKRVLSEASFRLDLRDFETHSSRQKAYGQKPVAACILFLLFFLMGAIPALTDHEDPQHGTYLINSIVWGLLLVASVFYARVSRTDVLVYYNRYNGNPLLTLYYNLPDKETFAGFVKDLDDRLEALNPRISPASSPAKNEQPFPSWLN